MYTNLEQSLSALETAQIIRRAGEDEPAFLFKHTLTQEAAYASLLVKSRRDLHRRVAQAYEALYPDQPDEYAALLAQHYGEAGDLRKTLEYSMRAGDAAARLNANVAAIAHYDRALAMAQAIVRSDPGARSSIQDAVILVYRRRGRALELCGQYDQAAANYVEMEAEANRYGGPAFRLAAMMEHAKLLSTPNPNWDRVRGRTLAERALALARELGDRAAQARLLWILLLSNYYGSVDLEQGARYGEESAALARELGLREQLAHSLNDLGGLYLEQGQVRHSLEVTGQAEALWRELNNGPMLTDALANTVFGHFYLGEFDTAIRVADEGYRIGQAIGNTWGQANCHMIIGQILIEQGQWGRAVDVMESTIRLGDESGHPGVPIMTRSMLAWALGDMGAIEQGLEVARVAIERADRLPPFRSWALATLARVHLLGNDPDAAAKLLADAESQLLMQGSAFSPIFVFQVMCELEWTRSDYRAVLAASERLLAFMRNAGGRVAVPDALLFKGKALLALGQIDAAEETLRLAETEATALGSVRSLWLVLPMLADVAMRRGQPEEAARLRARARDITRGLLDSLHQPELRSTFEKRLSEGGE